VPPSRLSPRASRWAQTSDVVAVVKANGRLYSASKEVKVTIGGCGG
jgi:sulfur-oxidizing protein SoxY